jgi:hypothetical protein
MFLIIKMDAKVLTPLQTTQNPTKTTDEKRPTKRITIQNTTNQHQPNHKKIVVSIAPKNNRESPPEQSAKAF